MPDVLKRSDPATRKRQLRFALTVVGVPIGLIIALVLAAVIANAILSPSGSTAPDLPRRNVSDLNQQERSAYMASTVAADFALLKEGGYNVDTATAERAIRAAYGRACAGRSGAISTGAPAYLNAMAALADSIAVRRAAANPTLCQVAGPWATSLP